MTDGIFKKSTSGLGVWEENRMFIHVLVYLFKKKPFDVEDDII